MGMAGVQEGRPAAGWGSVATRAVGLAVWIWDGAMGENHSHGQNRPDRR